jgi:DNA polymerase kappa
MQGASADDAENMRWLSLFAHDKAGMNEKTSKVSKAEVNRIIWQNSKDSPHYENEKRKEALQLEKIRHKKAGIERWFSTAHPRLLKIKLGEAHALLAEMEASRDLSRTHIVVDMDMFFIAVEIRDDPTLRGKPCAVGGLGMLSTSNYEARKYGIRSAMPGFIAKKLCPQLILVKHHGDKYREASATVREVLQEYDSNLKMMSLDEAYLDVTDYLASNERGMSDPQELAKEIRKKIWQATGGLTASCGIAPNASIAKIASDFRKPNGQFFVPPTKEAVLGFMHDLPVRKIGGVGKVMERNLSELGVETCSDVRGDAFVLTLQMAFKPRSYEWLLRKSLGLGSSAGSEESPTFSAGSARKSISSERTFKATKDFTWLLNECVEVCEGLAQDAAKHSCRGKNVTLKIKTDKFKLLSRSKTISKFICSSHELQSVALPLLRNELKVNPSMSVRLLGVRLGSLERELLVDPRMDIKMWMAKKQDTHAHPEMECPVCKEVLAVNNSAFNEHINACLDNTSKPLGSFAGSWGVNSISSSSSSSSNNSSSSSSSSSSGKGSGSSSLYLPSSSSSVPQPQKMGLPSVLVQDKIKCPLCNQCLPNGSSNASLNTHIDLCLTLNSSEGSLLLRPSPAAPRTQSHTEKERSPKKKRKTAPSSNNQKGKQGTKKRKKKKTIKRSNAEILDFFKVSRPQ